jgi:predicted metalloprotease with PDZ domain
VGIATKISLKKLNQHLVKVEMRFTSPYDNPILEMPSWTPGSYLIREYSRHVQRFNTTDNAFSIISSKKISKNNWQLKCPTNTILIISYEIYAFDLTVRTSYLDNRKCLLNPAGICMYILDASKSNNSKSWPIKLTFEIPEKWELFTSLKSEGSEYFAGHFDELVDSPIAIAHEDVISKYQYTYTQSNQLIPNTVVFIGDKSNEDIEKFSNDIQKLQDNSVKMFGQLPYDRYLWLIFITEKGRGGLEHKYSNTSIITRYSFKDPKQYAKVLSLEAHEHFHTYNIKRIRPKQLGPFDYEKEVYTKLLWVAEGLTSFYDNIILPRSNLVSVEEYWDIFSEDLERYYQIPGRHVISLEESSFDTWIKLYRPNENSVNSLISYYLKGGIVGFMLDLEIRNQSNWKNSLDSFYQFMYEKYKEESEMGFEEDDLRNLIESATNTSLDDFWNKYISGTDEIDLAQYLALIGMKLEFSSKDEVPYTGINFNGKSTLVKSILRDSPAESAGIYAFDEIIAINGYKINNSTFNKILNNFQVNDIVDIQLFRDGKLLTVQLSIKESLKNKIKISMSDAITQQEKQYLDSFFYQETKVD